MKTAQVNFTPVYCPSCGQYLGDSSDKTSQELGSNIWGDDPHPWLCRCGTKIENSTSRRNPLVVLVPVSKITYWGIQMHQKSSIILKKDHLAYQPGDILVIRERPIGEGFTGEILVRRVRESRPCGLDTPNLANHVQVEFIEGNMVSRQPKYSNPEEE